MADTQSFSILTAVSVTPQKFNMEPEKKSLEKEIPFGNHHFSGSMLNFGGVHFYFVSNKSLRLVWTNPQTFWDFLTPSPPKSDHEKVERRVSRTYEFVTQTLMMRHILIERQKQNKKEMDGYLTWQRKNIQYVHALWLEKDEVYLDVSENRGTPKSSILIGFSIINHPFWGYHYFWKHPYIVHYSTRWPETWCSMIFQAKHHSNAKLHVRYKGGPRTSYKWGKKKPMNCLING